MKQISLIALLLLAAAGLMGQTNPDSTVQHTGTVVRNDSAIGSQINAAVMRGDIEKARMLLVDNPDYVFSKDQHGWTPLYWAAASGRKEVVQLLLANGADINALNQHFTPLHAAVMNHHPDVADLLIASNAQVTIFDAAAGGYTEILKAELEADPTLVASHDDNGWTALQFAARNGQLDAVKLLLANKADVNAGDRHGMTALEAALAFSASAGPGARTSDTNHLATAELLLASGAVVTNTGITALHYAAGAGFTNVVREILDQGADVNANDGVGRTPLDFAAQHNHLDVIELLLSRGAKMSDEDRAGLMALKDAERGDQTRLSSPGHEYEVHGLVNQTMIRFNGTNLHASASFTVYVRDCGWMIKTVETNELGGVVGREVGSINGREIFECSGPPDGSGMRFGEIVSNNIPVGEQDSSVAGHLWLMFASKCYWPALQSDQLTPIYDWRASVAAASSQFGNRGKVSADWELLDGPGSLPREVRYFPNASYTITGTNAVGGMLFPAGFVFKQFQGDRLVKHVEVEVTAIRPVCSRANLIPLPSKGTMIVDRRFDSGVPNRPPSYQNPVFGRWLSVEESKRLAGINTSNTLRNLARAGISAFPETRSPSRETNTALPELALSIRCTNELVQAGDEIAIEFRITNRGTNDYRYANRTYDRSGRMNEYQLVATNSSGNGVTDPRANDKGFWFGGGLFQYATLNPGESFTKVTPLNRWALVKESGRYEVAGTYVSSSFGTNYVTVHSDPIRVTVQPRTPQQMDVYIAGLSNQIAALVPGKDYRVQGQMDSLVMKLMFTGSPSAVPALLNAMYQPGQGFWEAEALRFYIPPTDEVKQEVVATALRNGLANGMQQILSAYGCTNRGE
ncbi:MAG TPA: ankyrin repeat domain-containing protein, partial [Verrucomicrobiae bacterium]|nr:ankyrin repeat domain-containing protein [Verrucomicrobiae bacterium]